MSKLVVFMSMSLDGFITAADDGPGRGLGVGGEPLHAWLNDGNADPDSTVPERVVNARVLGEIMTAGAVIIGRRFYDVVDGWGGDHHDNVPIFVLTHDVPTPAVDGNIHFTDDLPSAVAEAKSAAGDRDVLMHGAGAVMAVLDAGLVDELVITLVPITLGSGRSLFDEQQRRFRLLRVSEGDGVVHLRYGIDDAG